MLTKYKSLAIVFTLLLSAASVNAETDSTTAEALMRKSGLWNQLDGLAPQIRAGFFAGAAQSALKLSASETDRVTKVLDDAYSPDRLRAASLKVLSMELDEKKIPELNRWFTAPLGRKVAKLEEEASADGSDPHEQLSKGSELLQSMSGARRTLIQDLVKASRAVETISEMTIETTIAAAEVIASVRPNTPRISSGDLRQSLVAQRPQRMVALSAMSAAGFARMYSSLSIDEIKQYIRFLKSDAGGHFTDAGTKAVGAAFKDGAAELGRRLLTTKG